MPAMHDDERDLSPLLARAGILLFEYEADGSLVSASGSCLGGPDPAMEVRAGLVTPSVVRRAAAGEVVTLDVRVADGTVTVRHEPVRGASGEVVKVVATACRRDERADAPGCGVPGVLPAAS